MDRREFLRRAGASGAGLAVAGPGMLLGACDGGVLDPGAVEIGGPLYRPPFFSPDGLTLTARRTTYEIASGVVAPVMTWGEGPVGPTIVARRGERARILMRNELTDPTIAHWHGLRPPEEMDGHPRFEVGRGESYSYDFSVDERAGTYWYHSHAHMRTGEQVYHGLAGLFIVRDDEEDALGLPSGEREIGLVLQDKRLDAAGRPVYGGMGRDMMEGFLGDTPFVNGVRYPTVGVQSALYRLRILGAANARIFRVGLSSGSPLVLIGTDGGLLERPVELPWVDVATGERVDLLVDFSRVPIGSTVRLRSLGFPDPVVGGGMGMGPGMGAAGRRQGAEFDLLEFRVEREVREESRIPVALGTVPRTPRASANRVREFRFRSVMMDHTINGRSFAMERIDERVPFGAVEIWRFVNDSPFPHPVHMHAVHFQVLSRVGGRGRVFPWEEGWKDTVLLHPGEQVEVISRFDSHRGLFLLHCHNLEHEDMGMMMNFSID
jgi:FtsP/CotA-like multicopper oxidase with cupredoxin domain